jgi:diguanylate cyclase
MAEMSPQLAYGNTVDRASHVAGGERANVIGADQLRQRRDSRRRVENSLTAPGLWNVRNDVYLVLTLAKQQLEEARLETESLRLSNERLQQALADAARRGKEADRLAHHDELTGLPNRLHLKEQLQRKIDEAVRRRRQLALLFIDLDGFKDVNDRFGHSVGDKLLAATAKRIAASIRAGDIACRYGGDEFVVLLTNVSDAAVAAGIAGTIRDRIGECFSIDSHVCHITASIGLALCPSDGENWDALLRRADAAMYNCKRVRLASNGASAS